MRILLDSKYENVEIISEPVDDMVDFKIIDGARIGEVWKIKTCDLKQIEKWEKDGSY